MAYIKQLGWAGAWFALGVFAAGFGAASVYHNGIAPTACSASPATPTAPQVPARTVYLIDSTEVAKVAQEIAKLAEAVAGVRNEVGQLAAAVGRLENRVAKR